MQNFYSYHDSDIRLSHSEDICPNPFDFGMHVHEVHEIYCFVSGAVRYNVEGRIYTPEPGSLMLMRSAESHCLMLEHNMPYERWTLHFSPAVLTGEFAGGELLAPFTDRHFGEYNYYRASEFHGIKPLDVFQSFGKSGILPERQSAVAGIITLLSLISPVFEKKRRGTPDGTDARAGEIIEYINTNLASDLSVEELCRLYHLSGSQLGRIFRKATGATVGSYIRTKRLITAYQLMAAGQRAQDACRSCGFGDYSAFFRAYKKHFGCPPTRQCKEPYSSGD